MTYKNSSTKFLLLSFILILFIYFTFFYIQSLNANSVQTTVKTMLHSEIVTSNPNQIARTLVDLENLGIIRCTDMKQFIPKNEIFLDSLGKSDCKTNQWLLMGTRRSAVYEGLNGSLFKLEYLALNPASYYISLLLIYFLTSLILIIILLQVRKIDRTNKEIIHLKESHANELKLLTQQVIHDIKSPLSLLKVVSQLLSSNENKYKKYIVKASLRMQEIINDLERSPQSPNLQKVKVNKLHEIVSDLIDEKSIEYKNKKNFRLQLEQLHKFESYSLEVNIIDILRVLSNLINNSFEATMGKGIVFVQTKNDTRFFYIRVQDNGPGLDDKYIDRMTNIGFSQKSGSKGLGLYHAKNVIIEHQGTLKIYNTYPGLSVDITLPIISLDS